MINATETQYGFSRLYSSKFYTDIFSRGHIIGLKPPYAVCAMPGRGLRPEGSQPCYRIGIGTHRPRPHQPRLPPQVSDDSFWRGHRAGAAFGAGTGGAGTEPGLGGLPPAAPGGRGGPRPLGANSAGEVCSLCGSPSPAAPAPEGGALSAPRGRGTGPAGARWLPEPSRMEAASARPASG